jgi:CHAP domain
MSGTRIRVGGTSRLGWKSTGEDRLALDTSPDDRPRRTIDRRGPVSASRPAVRRVASFPPRPPEQPRVVKPSPVLPEWHSAGRPASRRSWRPRLRLRRLALVVGAAALAITLLVTLPRAFGHDDSYPMPSAATLAGLSVPQRIVAIAQSQVGYTTNPSNSYCNKFSAYWGGGQSICPSGERSEEWCADFAAWAWHGAGLSFPFGYRPGEINGAAVSFYEWAVDNGEWHPAGSGYVASPGDVAVYGLSLAGNPSAAHVAVVTSDTTTSSGPDVVNGDGDQTGFSVVETGTSQLQISVGQNTYPLSGYVSPP